MTWGEGFMKKRNCRNNDCSVMSNIAWCGLNNNKILRLHDFCPHPKCDCHNQIIFTPKQFQLEGNGCKITMKKVFKGIQKAWNSFLKPTINTLAPTIGVAVGAKSENTVAGEATANILKSITGRRNLSLKDLHGKELGLNVTWLNFT